MLGEWMLAEGPIYDMFDPDRHVVDFLPTIACWVALGVDYGTSNPSHAELLALGADGVLYIPGAWRQQGPQRAPAAHRCGVQRTFSRLAGLLPAPAGVHLGRPSRARPAFGWQLHRDGFTSTLADNSELNGIRGVDVVSIIDNL